MWWGADEDDFLNTFDKIPGCLEDAGLFAAAIKCLFFDTEISWCGKMSQGDKCLTNGSVGVDWRACATRRLRVS